MNFAKRFMDVLAMLALFGCSFDMGHAADLSRPVALVATKRLAGSVYEETVIVAAPLATGQHIGFIVNRPTEIKLAALLPDDASANADALSINAGGPMFPQTLFVVARTPAAGPGELFELIPGLVVAIDQADIRRLIDQAPKDSRYFAGLMLWQPDELEDEIDAGAWEVRPAQTAIVFSANPANLWKALYRGAGQVEANAGSLAPARTARYFAANKRRDPQPRVGCLVTART
jgi:putative transcriptional regulator